MPQQDTGSFHINKDKILILIRLNLLQINHQVQILINVNVSVVTVKVGIVTPAHNLPACSRSNIQLHAVLIAKVSQVYPINLTLRRDDDAYSKGISGCCTASRESFWER